MTAWIHVGLLQSESEMIYLHNKVYLIIIHRNTTYLLDVHHVLIETQHIFQIYTMLSQKHNISSRYISCCHRNTTYLLDIYHVLIETQHIFQMYTMLSQKHNISSRYMPCCHRNTTYLLDIYHVVIETQHIFQIYTMLSQKHNTSSRYIPCCHKHQQQRHHKGNINVGMFIHYMYVNKLFPLVKAIPIMFEHVTTHYQTLQTWIGHNATRYHNFNALPYIFSQFSLVWGYLKRVSIISTCYHTRYCKFSLNLAWFGAICNALLSNL